MKRHFVILALLPLLGACNMIPEGTSRSPHHASTAIAAREVMPQVPANACLADLGQRQASFAPMPDRYYGAGCSAVGTVRLAALRGDEASMSLSGLGMVTCPLAETFAGWARYGADRAAQQILGSPLVKIETMGSYNCRNVAGSTRRSAHATANAIDVSGFVLADGRRITIAGNWYDQSASVRRFLTTVHSSACKRFGVVLGPSYNPAHHDHLHLELSGRQVCK